MKKSYLLFAVLIGQVQLSMSQSTDIQNNRVTTPRLGVGQSTITSGFALQVKGNSILSDNSPTDNVVIGSTQKPDAKLAIFNNSFRHGVLIDAQDTPAGYGLWLKGSGRIDGDMDIKGTLSKASGSFKIDHPLDPLNKYLYHSFVESPDMMNIYNGNIVTDANGLAEVQLPDYFEALNRDFRYQLTVIGEFTQAIVFQKVKNNKFIIKTQTPNVEVSWQVTGIRKDAYAEKNRIPNTVEKPESEKGKHLYPESFKK